MNDAAHPFRTAALASLALVGFAANSLLCRAALGPRLVDASTFTLIRLASGALILTLLLSGERGGLAAARTGSTWRGAFALFSYAIAFSFAYLALGVATGALILFGAVQATMIGWGLRSGERLGPREWVGCLAALSGLVVLVLPGLSAPDPLGALLMFVAGVAWGIYSLLGRGAKRPLGATGGNFARSVPLAVAASLLTLHAAHISPRGAALAVASGALASGLGYTLWYAALPGLRATQAAVVQLAAPVLVAAAGAVLLRESISERLLISGCAILGGIALVVLAKRRR